MIWLQRPPWLRWAAASLIAVAAIWAEVNSNASIDHPFAIAPIAAGEAVTQANVEMRPVPAGLIEPVDEFGFASHDYSPGDPITPGGIMTDPIAPTAGWWAIEIAVPAGARPGDEVQIVLVDLGTVIPGSVVAIGDEDTFSTHLGSIAIPPEHAAEVAAAASDGRAIVLVSTG